MKLYDKFKRSDIDLSAVGFERPTENQPTYFCTPKGAKIIGCEGVDGIHYCFVHGFGETVFAVNPAGLPGDYVHPVASNFHDLLCLLLACGCMAAIEQAHGFTKAQFEKYVSQQNADNSEVLKRLETEFALSPLDNPYEYIKDLQQSFDYSKIKFTPDYYDFEMNFNAPALSEWKVYYKNGYWGKSGRGRAGSELKTDKSFLWGREAWQVPAVYICTQGVVADFCAGVDFDRMKAFMDKWQLWRGDVSDYESKSDIIERENPLNIDFHPTLYINDVKSRSEYGSGLTWMPDGLLPPGTANQPESRQLVEHYGLDRNMAWCFQRFSFPWKTQRKPKEIRIKLSLERCPENIEGLHFKNPKVGDVIRFRHPITDTEYILTVKEYKKSEFDYFNDRMEYPKHHTFMLYTLEPDIPDTHFRVRDCLENQKPKIVKNMLEPEATYDVAFGVIDSADGPTALSHIAPRNLHTALSSLRFEPTDDVEWKIVFTEKTVPDMEIDLLT